MLSKDNETTNTKESKYPLINLKDFVNRKNYKSNGKERHNRIKGPKELQLEAVPTLPDTEDAAAPPAEAASSAKPRFSGHIKQTRPVI